MNAELLHAVDGFDLPQEYRVLLRPGEAETDFQGNIHRLPQFFYEIGSWQEAHEVRLAPHFTLAELMLVDCREARAAPEPVSALCAVCDRATGEVFGGFSPRSRCAGFHQREWRLPVACASNRRREKHSCLGHGRKYLPRRRYFSQ